MSVENLQSEPIFVRSPYIIDVDEPLQIEARVDLFIWNRQDPPPVTPTYTLSKKIANSTDTDLSFNLSHYAKENISFLTESEVAFNTSFTEIDQEEWTYVKVRRYTKLNGEENFTLLDTKTYIALDGWGYYQQGINPELGSVLLDEGVYQYYYDPNNPAVGGVGYQQPINSRYGDVKIVLAPVSHVMRYTDLVTGDVFTLSPFAQRLVTQTFLVYPLYAQNGNLVEYLDDLGDVIWSCTMQPINECKYEVNTIDFVNKFGVWQRTFGFKASRKTLSVTTEEHDLFSRDLVNPPYSIYAPENRLFNVNGRKQIKLNTGWINNDSYNDIVLQPMMLSERMQINREPVIMRTRSTELFENINMHLINYELTFEYAFDVINNVV